MTSTMLSAAPRPTLAKNARMGHPRSDMGKEKKDCGKGGPPAGFVPTRRESVAAPCRAQKRQAAITRTRDKVQVIGAVISMEAAGHDEHYAISSIAAHPCKKRKDRAPTF